MSYFILGNNKLSVEEISQHIGEDFSNYLSGYNVVKNNEEISPAYLAMIADFYTDKLIAEWKYNEYCEFLEKYNTIIREKIKGFSDEIEKLHELRGSFKSLDVFDFAFYESLESVLTFNNALKKVINRHGNFENESILQDILYDTIYWTDCEVFEVKKEMPIGNGRVDLGVFHKGELYLNIELKRGKIKKADYYQAYEYTKKTGVKTILIGSKDSESIDGGMCDNGVFAYKTEYCFPVENGCKQVFPCSIYFTALENECEEFEELIKFVANSDKCIEIPYLTLAKLPICNFKKKVDEILENAFYDAEFLKNHYYKAEEHKRISENRVTNKAIKYASYNQDLLRYTINYFENICKENMMFSEFNKFKKDFLRIEKKLKNKKYC